MVSLHLRSRALPLQLVLVWTLVVLLIRTGNGEDPPKYSDEVFAKAERILGDHGLRRVGNQLQAMQQGELSRMFAEETRGRRGLRQLLVAVEEAERAASTVEMQIEMLENQLGLWNAQYAAEGNQGGRNNSLVARINAGNVELKQLVRNRDMHQGVLKTARDELRAGEAEYSERLLKMRALVGEIEKSLRSAQQVREVEIALQVIATRFATPTKLEVDPILDPLDRRLRKLEESVFEKTLSLETVGSGLAVEAVIGQEPVRMVVDSGASLVLIPRELAEKLELKPAVDAKALRMVTADGREIPASEIIIPRMRIGKFVAENVRGAILSESLPGAQPLLGLSFLEKFRFEIDAAGKKMTLWALELPKP